MACSGKVICGARQCEHLCEFAFGFRQLVERSIDHGQTLAQRHNELCLDLLLSTLGGIQSSLVLPSGFRIGIDFDRLIPGLYGVGDRTRDDSPLEKVLGDLSRPSRTRFFWHALDSLSSGSMQLLFTPWRDLCIERLLYERVSKGVG